MNPKIFALLGAIAYGTYVQAQTAEAPDEVSIVIYEKASRMGAIGDFLGGFISKDKGGQVYIDPFRLHPSKQNKVSSICFVNKQDKEMTDDELIAMNLKASLEGDADFVEQVGSKKVKFNKYSSYMMLGTGLANDECEYIAAASTEIKEIDQVIRSVDSVTEKTFKQIEGFKISSSKLWADPQPGKPISRQEYLSLAWCGFPNSTQKTELHKYGVTTANGCKNLKSEMVLENYASTDEYNTQKITSYLEDRATAKKSNQTAEQVRKTRTTNKYAAFARNISYQEAAFCVAINATSVASSEAYNSMVASEDAQTMTRASLSFMEIYAGIGMYHRDFNGVPQSQLSKALMSSVEVVKSMSAKQQALMYLACLKRLADGTK